MYAGRHREAADRYPHPLFTAVNFGKETDPCRVTGTWLLRGGQRLPLRRWHFKAEKGPNLTGAGAKGACLDPGDH